MRKQFGENYLINHLAKSLLDRIKTLRATSSPEQFKMFLAFLL